MTEADRAKQARVGRWLVHILKQGRLPTVERARGGDLLARLGDPRFDENAWRLPAEPLLGFVEIPAGPFRMGSDPKRDKAAMEREQPQHDVTLPAFYIARYPTTVAQFRAFVEESKYRPRDPACLTGVANHPVIRVTWHDALAYCDWLAGKLKDGPATPEPLRGLLRSGKWRVTLPSEAEWEKAARGPSTGSGDGRLFPWGDRFDPDCANTSESGLGRTSPVGAFSRDVSPFGVLDMSGNVWEWTRSLWGENYSEPQYKYPYRGTDGREDLKAPDRILRVLRGGSYYDDQRYARCAARGWYFPVYWDDLGGFRVVVSPIRL